MLGLVLTTYAHWPNKLITSVEESGLEVTWYVHHHGADPAFADRVETLGERENFGIHLHRENRGLSRSWNEGLHQAYADGCELALLLNDDLHFVDGGLRQFIDFAHTRSEYGMGFLQGLETGTSPHAGQIIQQGFACCIVTPLALETVGYFDQNFVPAYYEDFDYFRRCHLAKLRFITAPGVLAEHERSKTTRDNPEIAAQAADTMQRNGAYYSRKWGPPGAETHQTPFADPSLGLAIRWEDRANPYPGC